MAAPGVQILSTLPTYPTPLSDQNGEGDGRRDGTSMASPSVAAAATLLVAADRTPSQVLDAIRTTDEEPLARPEARLGVGMRRRR